MARRRRPSQTLHLSLLLSSIRSSSLVSSVSLSWSENIVTVSFSGGSRSMFSVSSSAHRITLTVLCLVGLRSVRISSRFTVIFIAHVRALIVSHAVDSSPLRPSLKVSRDDVVKPFGSLSTGFVIFLGGNSDGFIGLFTETYMLTMSYLSFLKRILVVFLPVGSLGSLSSSSPYSSPSSSSPAFSRRSVSPSAHVRRCISKSITVLLSCGAVRSGPEDAADLVSTIFRGADWISTSLFNVTKFQPFGSAVNLTHSSFAMNSLSLYLRGFSKSIVCVVWFYVCSSTNSCSPRL
ncbi:hypothetical protein DY000_02061982 [Brassica cretica]|uniref:Secreted protein n=1 Tax=Brassica cretica TaxID=69181 RepID=A0ABQ7B295_BRACR|nr:hypothetical protein DY000_02061982 [Brassica cretica]